MHFRTFLWVSCLWFFCIFSSITAEATVEPITPNASPEARALLQLLCEISGQFTLMGQHNNPNTKDRNSQFAAKYIGEMPVIWSTDMGFAKAGDTDSYLARPDIVEEAKRQHRMGFLVTICWHAVPPIADEPVIFRPQRDADPAYRHVTANYRTACGLPPLPMQEGSTNFSGVWEFNEEKSQLDNFAVGNCPYKMEIFQ